MPVAHSSNPRLTDTIGATAGGDVSVHPGVGANRVNDPGRIPPLRPALFLERHGHTPMNLDVQVLASQNDNRRGADSSPAAVEIPSMPSTVNAVPIPTPPAANGKISIRIVPAMDSFTRLPLRFDPIDRKVDDGEVLYIGRHTDRLLTEHPTAIVFRSKVVSRNHAKLWPSNGQWYLQDVGSSSGTFLNHIRLSPPSIPSTSYQVKDGDIVQLGIDFRVAFSTTFGC